MTSQQHMFTMENREKAQISGIEEVVSFSDESIELRTCMGDMLIKGRELNMSKLDTDTGKLDINGEISLVQYCEIKRKTGIFEGLFR